MPSSSYPAFHLPDWQSPPAEEDARINYGSMSQAWSDALPKMGFSLLFESEYVGLEKRLEEAARLLARRKQYGKHAEPSTSPSRKHWYQWWRHPDGLIATVDRYSNDGGKTWLFNNVEIIANLDGGYAQDQSPTRFSADGAGVFVLSASGNADIEAQWQQIRKAAASGHLIPLSQWPILGQQRGLLERQEWSLPLGRVSQKMLDAPAKRYHHAHRLRRRHLPALVQPWKQRIEQSDLPAPEKHLWLQALAMEAGNASIPAEKRLSSSAYGPLPAWVRRHLSGTRREDTRKELVHEQASRILTRALAEFGLPDKHALDWDERAVLAQWLSVLEDRRHPHCQAPALARSFSTSLDRLGLRFEHVLFLAAPTMRGALGKLAWWQNQQAPAALDRLCRQPDPDGRTLPMRWLRVWMEVHNQRVVRRQSLHRRTHARRALEQLMEASSPHSWVLSTARHSMWDPALGHHINLPIDQDLVAEHRLCLKDVLSWLDAHQLPTPSELVLAPAVRLDLLAPQGLAPLLDRCYSQAAGTLGSATDRAALLAPITAHLQRTSLERASPLPGSRPPTRPRTRL